MEDGVAHVARESLRHEAHLDDGPHADGKEEVEGGEDIEHVRAALAVHGGQESRHIIVEDPVESDLSDAGICTVLGQVLSPVSSEGQSGMARADAIQDRKGLRRPFAGKIGDEGNRRCCREGEGRR